MKKLLIDVNPVVPYYVSGKVNGIGRTTLELVKALAKVESLPFEVELYSQNMKGIGGRDLGTPFTSHHLYAPNRERWNKVLSHFPVREWMTGYDVMHITHNFEYVHRPEKCIATIHDAMFFSHPEAFLGHEAARTLYPPFARRCKAIITCSAHSKGDIVNYMGVAEEKVHVIHWGVDHEVLRPRERVTHEAWGDAPFFLSVSCDIGRKNTIAVIRAFEQYARRGTEHQLVLVWAAPPADIMQEVEASPARKRIHFVKNLSNEALAQLYSDATAVFFPSRYEGFGLPVIEAMAAGTPVVTCANSSLKEVGGEVAMYVEPDDVEAMADLMLGFEESRFDYNSLQQASLQWASRFTWERAAEETVKVYQLCLQ